VVYLLRYASILYFVRSMCILQGVTSPVAPPRDPVDILIVPVGGHVAVNYITDRTLFWYRFSRLISESTIVEASVSQGKGWSRHVHCF
jgi:hypothetical protein